MGLGDEAKEFAVGRRVRMRKPGEAFYAVHIR